MISELNIYHIIWNFNNWLIPFIIYYCLQHYFGQWYIVQACAPILAFLVFLVICSSPLRILFTQTVFPHQCKVIWERGMYPVAMPIINSGKKLAEPGLVGWLVVLGFKATLTAKVISWRSLTHMCFLAFSHQY